MKNQKDKINNLNDEDCKKLLRAIFCNEDGSMKDELEAKDNAPELTDELMEFLKKTKGFKPRKEEV